MGALGFIGRAVYTFYSKKVADHIHVLKFLLIQVTDPVEQLRAAVRYKKIVTL